MVQIDKVLELRRSVCKGCLTYETMNEDQLCPVPHKINRKPCPCSKCMIKMVCEDTCDEFRLYKGTFVSRNWKQGHRTSATHKTSRLHIHF